MNNRIVKAHCELTKTFHHTSCAVLCLYCTFMCRLAITLHKKCDILCVFWPVCTRNSSDTKIRIRARQTSGRKLYPLRPIRDDIILCQIANLYLLLLLIVRLIKLSNMSRFYGRLLCLHRIRMNRVASLLCVSGVEWSVFAFLCF